MRQVVLRRPGELEVVDAPERALADDELRVAIERVGVCGTDYHAFHGDQPFFTYPRVLGHEVSARVLERGRAVRSVEVGDTVCVLPYRVCGSCLACRRGAGNACRRLEVLGVHVDGGLCERMVLTESQVLRSDALPLETLALVECLSVAQHAVRRSALLEGEPVVVLGAGPIGLGVAQCARAAGADVRLADRSAERLAFARTSLRLSTFANTGEELRPELAEWTQGEGAPVVFDCTGNAASMDQALHLLAHTGRLVFVGLHLGEVRFPDVELHRREATLHASRNATREDFARVVEHLESGRLAPTAMITHRAPVDDFVNHFARWSRPECGVIKALVAW